MSSMELEGMDEIIKRVDEMGRKGARIENQALKKAGEVINDEIKSRAPKSISPRQPKGKSQSWRTGDHAYKILTVSAVRSQNGRKYVLAGIQKGDNSKAFYLKFKEFGSSKESAKPFMGPAYESKKKEAEQIIKEEIKKGLNLG